MIEHTLKAFDKELDAIGHRIAQMGGIAEKMVVDAMNALANADTVLAHEIVATDPRLDALQREIEDMAVLTIARRLAVASDLRELIGAIRIAGGQGEQHAARMGELLFGRRRQQGVSGA